MDMRRDELKSCKTRIHRGRTIHTTTPHPNTPKPQPIHLPIRKLKQVPQRIIHRARIIRPHPRHNLKPPRHPPPQHRQIIQEVIILVDRPPHPRFRILRKPRPSPLHEGAEFNLLLRRGNGRFTEWIRAEYGGYLGGVVSSVVGVFAYGWEDGVVAVAVDGVLV